VVWVFVGLTNLEKKGIFNFDPPKIQNDRSQLNDFVPLPTSSSCFTIKNNIKDTSPINVGSIIIGSWDWRRGESASSTSLLPFGPSTRPAATGAAAAEGTAKHFQRLWPNWPQAPHLRYLATGLSIAVAGLVGDNIVDEKMNFVVGATM
jgi:hypothetical protein